MKHNLKKLNLYNELTKEEIPYSKNKANGMLSIDIPKTVKQIPPEYNQITDEITGDIFIDKNQHITEISGFDNLKTVGNGLRIQSNDSLTDITGFNSLEVVGWSFTIESNKSLTKITGFGNLTYVGLNLHIKFNDSLTNIAGFNNLTSINWNLVIEYNESLIEITGFNNLTSVGNFLYIQKNPKLVTMSIPSNMIRAVNYDDGYSIVYDNDLEFKSPGDFINSPEIYQDLVTRFNPGDHGDLVVKQIVENVEEWGTDYTKSKVYSFLGKYLTPEQLKLTPTHIQHRYHPDYQGTTGRDVAKVNSGEVYGMF